jgi:hypothetical protein
MKRILLSLFAAAALLFGGLAPAQVATDAGKTGIARAAHLLCSGTTALAVTGTLTETTLATCTVPAGAMGLTGSVRIETTWSYTNSANSKTLRVKFGGTSYLAVALTTSATGADVRIIRNRNSASSQIGNIGTGTPAYTLNSSAALPTSSVDTTAAVTILLTGQLANTGETITLEGYEVWLLQ